MKKSKIQNRAKEYIHIRECGSVLFAFDVDTPGVDSRVKEFIRFFQKYNIRYTGIAVDLKAEENTDSVYASHPDFIVMGKKDVNWLDIPRPGFIEKVRQIEHNVYIDFDLPERIFPCDYLLNISPAKMIVGFDKEAELQYDLCFPDRPGRKDASFSEQVIEYLNTIR